MDQKERIQRLIAMSQEDERIIPHLLEIKAWRLAMNRGYYAAFNLIAALLIKNGLEPATMRHRQQTKAFDEQLVQKGIMTPHDFETYKTLSRLRRLSDRDENYRPTEEETQLSYRLCSEFCTKAREILATKTLSH